MKEMILGNPGRKTRSNVGYSSKFIIETYDFFYNNIRYLVLNQRLYRWFESGEISFANSTAGDGKNYHRT